MVEVDSEGLSGVVGEEEVASRVIRLLACWIGGVIYRSVMTGSHYCYSSTKIQFDHNPPLAVLKYPPPSAVCCVVLYISSLVRSVILCFLF